MHFTDISQGSVATQLRCDGIFSNDFITNFPHRWKSFENLSMWRRYGQKFAAYFLGHPIRWCTREAL